MTGLTEIFALENTFCATDPHGTCGWHTAVFTDATKLAKGDDVRLAGVSVGRVTRVALDRDAKARGVPVQTPFVGNAMWVTSLSDPDGYRIDFESSTDVPEETVYSE